MRDDDVPRRATSSRTTPARWSARGSSAVGLEDDPIALMQADGFSHADLARRARRVHERRLARGRRRRPSTRRSRRACSPPASRPSPTPPPPPSSAARRRKLIASDGEPPRVAIVADGIGATHGVTRTLEQVRERGVPGFEVELIGTDAGVDRRLDSVAEVDLGGLARRRARACPRSSRRSPRAATTSSTSPRPGPAGIAAALVAKAMGMPLVGSYHTELAAYAGLRTGDPRAPRWR